jgi:hypothetical protein
MYRWLAVLAIVACGEKEPDDTGGATPDPTDTTPDDTEPRATDTGGGDNVFQPRYVNIDAAFGVDANGQVVSVVDPVYGERVPTITVWIGSDYWSVYDWGSDEVCRVTLDISGAVPGAWVEELGLWYGFDAPGAVGLYHDCTDMEEDGTDPLAFAESLTWSVGIGNLAASYASSEGYAFGGYSAVDADPAPGNPRSFAMTGIAFPVDPYSMTVALETTSTYGYYYETLDPTAIALPTGTGVVPGYYLMTSWWVLELP